VKWFGMVSACAAFVLIGALQALYGPAVSAFRADFGISVPVAGLALSAHFVGGIAGVLWYARSPLTGTRKLAASLVAMAVGAAGVALAPTWPLALVAALVAGVGFGGIDYGCNDMVARAFRRRGSAVLNVLNAHFGIGAIAGPLLIGLLGPHRYPAIFLGFAVVSLLLLPGLRGPAEAEAEPEPAVTPARIRRRGLLAAFIVLYVMNVGVEAGVGGWEPTHLEAIGHSASDAASATSVYWLMMTLGRFLVVPLTLRVSDRAIVIGSCVGIAVCLALATVPGMAIVAYAGVGLFIAPVFPTGLPWLHRAVPGASRAGAYVFAASMLGGVAFPPLLGAGIEQAGAGSVPVLIFIVNALCLVAIWRIVRTESTLPTVYTQRV
jgi:FHS family glucose/mannose:H+ symporter-like MFS transporter